MSIQQSSSILVVDDHENWRELLVAILEADGHQVVTAKNSDEAQALLESNCFDAAILDMRLTDSLFDIQGMHLVKEAKRLHPSIKAIILTGFPDEEQRVKALTFYGADGYFEKVPGGRPFRTDEFSQLISHMLE
jgi:DNA-binding NtrC family response regulator